MDYQPSKSKILIINNKKDVRGIKVELINHNFKVLVANSGEQGIKTAKLEQPDLILLEILMPIMDGFETCRQLKADTEVKEIPIIFMSTQNQVFNKVTAFTIGAVDYINMPFNVDELIARVNTQVSLFSMQKQLKNANVALEQKVNERTIELKNKNEELVAAEEELRASNDAYRAINEKLSKQHADLQVAEAELKKRHEELQSAEEELQAINEELIDTIECLHENEQRLNEAQKLAKLGHYNLNFATGYWTSSNELDRIFGIDDKFDRTIEGWGQLIHTDFKHEMIDYFTYHIMQLHYKFNKEYKITNLKTKEDKWVHGLGELVFDSKGNLINMLGTIQDITERKQIEILKNKAMEALEHERYLMEALMQNIPDTIYFKDVDSKFTRINYAQAKMLGVKNPEDAIGKSDVDFFPKKQALRTFYDEQEIIKTGKPIVDKIERIEIADGRIRWVSTTKMPIKNNNGVVTSIVGVTRDVTEHKEIELTLIENEKQLQLIFDNSPAIMVLVNDKSEIVKINKTGIEFAQNDVNNILKQQPGNFLKCIESVQLTNGCVTGNYCGKCTLRKIIRDTIHNNTAYQKVEVELKVMFNNTPENRYFFVSSITANASQNKAYLVTIDDITDIKKVEEKIRQQEEHFRSMVENMPVLINAFDTGGNLIFWNKECENVTGYKANEVLGSQDVLTKLYPDKNYRYNKIDKYFPNIAKAKNIEIDLVNRKGEKRTIVWSNINKPVPLKNWAGWEVGIEITKRKQALKALMESESRFKQLANFTQEGILVHKNGIIRDVNQAVLNLTGYIEEELIGKQVELFIPDNYKKLIFERLITIAEKPYEIEIIKKDRKTFPAQIFAIDFDSEIEKIRVVSIRDITEQKQVQQRILNAVIQTEENERTRVAQELHDGIGPVLSTVKLYAQTYISTKSAEMKHKIERQLISGIDDALAQVSAISNNLSPHVLKDFGLKVAIEKYIARVNKVSNITIHFEYKYNGNINNAIETTLYRVAIELINNTVKHAQATEISLIIDNVNEFIQFVFTDNGKGFDMDSTKKTGSGMGLFNIENRVKSFNGQISFEKGEESGIAYNILIPVILL